MKTKKVIFKSIISILSLFIFISCNNSDGLLEINNQTNTLEVDNEEKLAINLLQNFAKDGTISTRNVENTDLKILNIQKETFDFEFKDSEITTRSGKVLPKTKANLYTFTFEKNSEKGFSIISSDERFSRVFAYTEKGSLSDTAHIDGLWYMIKSIPVSYKDGLHKYYNDPEEISTRATQTYIDIPSVISTKWDQWAPFNNNVPLIGSCRPPIGCTAVACAQVIAKLNPSSISYMNLSQLASTTYIYSWSPLANDAANFLYFISNTCLNTQYNCTGSSASLKDIRTYLSRWGINYDYRENNLNVDKVANSVSKGRPTLTRGNKKKGDKAGHAWVYSGIRAWVTGTPGNYSVKTLSAIYCNWGWGGSSDGWYYNGSHEHASGMDYPFLANNHQIYFYN